MFSRSFISCTEFILYMKLILFQVIFSQSSYALPDRLNVCYHFIPSISSSVNFKMNLLILSKTTLHICKRIFL